MNICDYNTTFKGINNISQDLLLNVVESNFKIFFDWAFLNIGCWFDIEISNSTLFGTNKHSKLLLAEDPSYTKGSVWQGIRKDWVWESGVVFNNTSPIPISGVFVNNVFQPLGSNYLIDYPLGRVIFNNALNTNTPVELNYSYKHVQVYRSCDSPWLNILQYSSYETNNKDISRTADGDWSIGGHHRIQMPAIVIESLSRSRSRPHEIGNNNLVIEQDIAFHILAENKNERNKLLDILRLQQDSVIWLFDTNQIAQNDEFPLDHNGNLKSNALMYPDIVAKYPWRKCWIKNVNLFDIESPHPSLHRGLVRATLEIISE
jgi:hypothetical protein